jgi:GTP pyrophosphokinase
VLEPDRYHDLAAAVDERAGAAGAVLDTVVTDLQAALRDAGVEAEVTSRRKALWSLNEKMAVKEADLADITDLLGVRVIVADEAACYTAVGVVHRLWTPLPRRFKDWIATPRYSTYQALHTTVIGPGGLLLEVQIRSVDMHRRAEWGVAAHWRYKQSARTDTAAPFGWMQRLSELSPAEAERSPTDFLEQLRDELAGDEVLCFTPRGELVSLPAGATPIDFAYAIHSEVGHGCLGAKVNGRLVPLTSKLQTGDRVEILTGRQGGPNRQWLDVVVSAKARQYIRSWIARERRAEQVTESPAVETAPAPAPPTPLRRPPRATRTADDATVLVDGDPSVASELAACCRPVHGDPIVGYLSRRKRAVVVHRDGCPQAAGAVEVPVSWARRPGRIVVQLAVEAVDRAGLLADTTRAIADAGGNILSSSTAADDGISRQRFELAVEDLTALDAVCQRLRAKVRGVIDAARV